MKVAEVDEGRSRKRQVEIPLLPELIDLCSRSAKAHAKLREFLDNGGFVAAFEIDESATERADHIVLRYQLGNGFMRCRF